MFAELLCKCPYPGNKSPLVARPGIPVVLRIFFVFLCGGGKWSGDLTIEFACNKIPRFCRALIAGDESESGANDLWGT